MQTIESQLKFQLTMSIESNALQNVIQIVLKKMKNWVLCNIEITIIMFHSGDGIGIKHK